MMEGDPGINHIQIADRFKNPAGEESMTFDHSEIIFFRSLGKDELSEVILFLVET